MPRHVSFTVVHRAAGVLALFIIAAFWSSTVLVELFGDAAAVAAVKLVIAWALLVFVPLLAVTGATGFAMAGREPGGLMAAKGRRMRIIAMNGLVVLAPAALFLAWKADAGEFDGSFMGVQAAELVAGAVNAVLMSLNVRDGLRLTGRIGARRTERVAT